MLDSRRSSGGEDILPEAALCSCQLQEVMQEKTLLFDKIGNISI